MVYINVFLTTFIQLFYCYTRNVMPSSSRQITPNWSTGLPLSCSLRALTIKDRYLLASFALTGQVGQKINLSLSSLLIFSKLLSNLLKTAMNCVNKGALSNAMHFSVYRFGVAVHACTFIIWSFRKSPSASFNS